jgi:catechol 2,3-dioxygenase-like lactoylglutathione lyase family enzyme
LNFASVRIITDELDRLVEFYEKVTGVSAIRPAPVFAELVFGPGCAHAADNHSVIVEFRVDDVDVEYRRLKPFIEDWVQEPTLMPWGNRSALLRDPDGNLVNLFTPVTEEAIERFSRRS